MENGQIEMFCYQDVRVEKKIRLIELFAGVGAQAMALRDIGADFEHWFVCEFDTHAVKSYNAIHGTNFEPSDIRNVHGADLRIADKDKYSYVMTYSFPCFTADTLVLTNSGYKMIVDVKPGDYVLTHDNSWQKVLRFFDNGAKQTFKVKAMPIDEIVCTENHRFYTREMFRTYPTYANGKRGEKRHFKAPEWKECRNLSKKDYIGIAINQKEELPFWNGIDIEWSGRERVDHKNDIQPLLSNASFWWIMGYYLGDGWERTSGGIVLAANEEKLNKLRLNLADTGLHYNVTKERTSYKVHLAIKELSAFVQMFGKYAHGKKVPAEVMNLPVGLLKSFLDGYFSADGCFTQGKFKATSVSRELIYGIGQCVAKVYKVPYSIYRTVRPDTCVIEGRIVNQRNSYSISFKTEKRKQDKAFYEDGYLWCPINSIEKDAVENVYDIEVDKSHSFTANGVIVHNCQDLSVAGKQRGMTKGSGTRSGLLWEVERILNELPKEQLPDVLLMENVPQVHSEQNKSDFNSWVDFLRSKGYVCHWKDLNARDYGIPQNRERCFMVSILSDEFVEYEWPTPIPLEKKMRDYLEENVDEKYYINSPKAQKLINKLVNEGKLGCGSTPVNPETDGTARTIKANYGKMSAANFDRGNTFGATAVAAYLNYNRCDKINVDVAKTLMARDYKGFNTGFDTQNGVIEWKLES